MSISDTNLVVAISDKPQLNYTTPVATAPAPNQAYVEQVMTEKSFIKKGVPMANNKGQTTGQRFATDSWAEGGHSTDISIPFDVTFQNIGRYLNAVMGATAVAPEATLFKHVHSLIDTRTTQNLPAYTIIQQAAPASGGLDIKAPSMTCKSLQISGDGTARCKATAEFMGSGEYTQPSAVNWGTHVKSTQGTQVCIYNTVAKLVRSDAPSGLNSVNRSLCESLGWEIGISNSFAEADYGCLRLFDQNDISKGVLRSHLPLVDTEISAKFKFKLPSNSTEMNLLENQSPVKLVLELLSTQTLTATSQVLRFTMPLSKYKMVDYSADNGFVYVSIEPDVLFSAADNKALEVELINNVPAYV